VAESCLTELALEQVIKIVITTTDIARLIFKKVHVVLIVSFLHCYESESVVDFFERASAVRTLVAEF
jgi:hypothetical protein